MKPKLNKNSRTKALKILRKLETAECFNKYGQQIYTTWKQHQVTHFILVKHGITQETLDDFIDLD